MVAPDIDSMGEDSAGAHCRVDVPQLEDYGRLAYRKVVEHTQRAYDHAPKEQPSNVDNVTLRDLHVDGIIRSKARQAQSVYHEPGEQGRDKEGNRGTRYGRGGLDADAVR